MLQTQLEIDGLLIEILRKPIKNIHLRIYPPEGQVRITAPLWLSLAQIRQQVIAKRAWIDRQRLRLKNQQAQLSPPLITGSSLYFLGEPYSLTFHENSKLMQVTLIEQTIHCFIKTNTSQEEKEKSLEAWYRHEMKKILPELILKWQAIIGVQVASFGIKKMKTRWGTCNTRAARIWLNLSLIKKPLICLEYVLVHEMVHLLEVRHNRRFYAFMDQFLPDWKAYQKLLEGKTTLASC